MSTCLITGADAGIGKAIAKMLAYEGYRLILISNSEEKLKVIREQIVSESNNHQIDIFQVDLSLQNETRSFCAEFNRRYQKLDILIHNAGVNLPVRKITAEGLEYMFAVNYLAPFLMTNLLMESLKKSCRARIINIGSNAEKYAKFDIRNLQGERSFSGMKQYSLTKLCNLMFTYEFARNLQDSGVAVSCLHPGGVRTRIMQHYSWKSPPKMIWFMLYPFLQTPEKASGYIAHLINAETSSIHGKYFTKGKRAMSSSLSMDQELSRQLWKLSEEMTNVIYR